LGSCRLDRIAGFVPAFSVTTAAITASRPQVESACDQNGIFIRRAFTDFCPQSWNPDSHRDVEDIDAQPDDTQAPAWGLQRICLPLHAGLIVIL